mgnify:CR=1 FL=1
MSAEALVVRRPGELRAKAITCLTHSQVFDLAIIGGGAEELLQRHGFVLVPNVLSATERDDVAATFQCGEPFVGRRARGATLAGVELDDGRRRGRA